MKKLCALLALTALPFGTAQAVERYTDARISQIETSDANILLFLEVLSGDAPPVGNGGSNEPFSKPYLFLANSATDLTNRKYMFASALAAQVSQATVRIRWEDAGTNAGRIFVLLQR